jgi:polysaccharide export outer membrane protein
VNTDSSTDRLPVGDRLFQKGTSKVIRRALALMMCMWALIGLSVGNVAEAQLSVPPSFTVDGTPYRINPGDELEIHVWGDERLQRDVLVLPDGTFAFPLVGQVNAAGRLPSELERVITAGLQPQYKGPVPQVTVSVKKASGYQFSIVGKVRNPGSFTPGRYVNVLEALAIAGGPSEFANLGNARLIRKMGNRMVVIPLRLQEAMKGDLAALNEIPRIESGDTLVVP